MLGRLVGSLCLLLTFFSVTRADEPLKPIALTSKVTQVQPMTGLVLWATNGAVDNAPIQLEFSYLTYASIVNEQGEYNWQPLEELLDSIASRKHQAIIRWHDTYVDQPTGVPAFITKLPDYQGVTALSEKKPTGFPDWSHPKLRSFLLEFFDRFAEKYDRDPRIAFVQVGFGLWSEYHIYDGPMELGKTFPSKEFQATFAKHLSKVMQQTPWMISIDAAAEERAPYASDPALLKLQFGLFDDSFNHAQHKKVNELNWNVMGRDRWKTNPTGGEFSFYIDKDQKQALAPKGPHGIPFSVQAEKFHISFMIADGQPRFQKKERLLEAGLACGYRFRLTDFRASPSKSQLTFTNSGIAPIYYDAFPTINGVRSSQSLRGLLPQESRTFEIPSGGDQPKLTIQCDRLVPGQQIQFDADLP